MNSLSQDMIHEMYPPEKLTQVYTDGSATEAVKDGGDGILVLYTNGRTSTKSVATGKHCTNYKAEMEALMQAMAIIEESDEDCSQVVILTDVLSVLEAVKNYTLPSLTRQIQRLAQSICLVLQWIPANCEIPGNEKADKLARLRAREDQPIRHISHQEKVTMMRTFMIPKPAKNDYHLLDRTEQFILVRLHTGHNRLNAHMHKKLKLSSSPNCSCELEDQTAEHILQ